MVFLRSALLANAKRHPLEISLLMFARLVSCAKCTLLDTFIGIITYPQWLICLNNVVR